jgi:Fe-Mn family superoxide dismutase
MTELKPLKYKALPGLTERQLAEHHDVLYAGYCKKTDEIRAQLAEADPTKANGTWADFRELKLEEGFAVNGVRLHEHYFDSLSATPVAPSEPLAAWIAEDFGSFEKWAADFAAVGMAARGWAVLAFDLHDGKLHNYLADMHNQGGVWGALPLVVMDVYEHAYFLDYATARKKYLEVMLPLLDWSAANAAVTTFHLAEHRR